MLSLGRGTLKGMDKPKVTPKDFFLWAGAMLSLYISVFTFISLLFSYIDFTFPDPLNGYVDPYSSGMRSSIATLLVLFPLFIFLMRLIRVNMMKDSTRKDIWVRRWALVFTIFVAGAGIAVDLITLINYFLDGDLTTRFLLKTAIVLLVAAGGLMHFLADIWGFWEKHPDRAGMVGWGVSILILLTIATGFLIMGSPNQVRLYRFDDQKVNNLQGIQYQVLNYWQQKSKLPATIADLNDPLSGFTLPVDPQGGTYTYSITGPMSFKLCATFNAATQPNSASSPGRPVPMMPTKAPYGPEGGGTDINALPWTHGVGEQCFTRTIDPERYPPYKKN